MVLKLGDTRVTANLTYSELDMLSFFEKIYPVGSIYIGLMDACPLEALIPGSSWTLIDSDATLQCSGNKSVGTSVEAGLPNITASWSGDGNTAVFKSGTGAGYVSNSGTAAGGGGAGFYKTLNLDLSRQNSIYGKSNTVQPKAFVVNIWKRVA